MYNQRLILEIWLHHVLARCPRQATQSLRTSVFPFAKWADSLGSGHFSALLWDEEALWSIKGSLDRRGIIVSPFHSLL